MNTTEQEAQLQSLPRPQPGATENHQSGITDPQWPIETPEGIEDETLYDDYRGRIDKQDHMTLLMANIHARDRTELIALLKTITEVSKENMEKEASLGHLRPLDHLDVPKSYRVTVTVGFGATLFCDKTGFDRYGISARKPLDLKVMPRFPKDHEDFCPEREASDLVFLIASDHQYVNVAIARYFTEHFNRRFREKNPDFFGGEADERNVMDVGRMEHGFGRPDKREFLRFDDGIDNLRPGEGEEMDHLVYVDFANHEPDWCVGGTYMVYRKIRENLPNWEFEMARAHAGKSLETLQEEAIGRKKKDGAPLSRECAGLDGMTPVYPDHTDPADGPLNAHIRKVQPRREVTDLFGIHDLERRFLRRPYPYFEGVGDGRGKTGLQFIAFMESIQKQFEHVTNMWQMNPDFPVAGTGIDALYAHNILSTVGGGYFFCPPDGTEFLGSGLFD